MSIFPSKLNTVANSTNSYLRSFFLRQKNKSYLLKPMKYGVFSGGKRFRAAIVVNTGKIHSIDYKKLIIIGSAIECIHSYSLIHDDLPSMDNDDFRRGKPSVHKKFNEAQAILAGDSLHDIAFELLSDKKTHNDSEIRIKLIQYLSISIGSKGLAGGQSLDLIFENKKIKKSKILEMYKMKTSSLFSYCCAAPFILAKKNENDIDFAKQYSISPLVKVKL